MWNLSFVTLFVRNTEMRALIPIEAHYNVMASRLQWGVMAAPMPRTGHVTSAQSSWLSIYVYDAVQNNKCPQILFHFSYIKTDWFIKLQGVYLKLGKPSVDVKVGKRVRLCRETHQCPIRKMLNFKNELILQNVLPLEWNTNGSSLDDPLDRWRR